MQFNPIRSFVWVIAVLGLAATSNAALITASNFDPTLNGSGANTLGNLIQIGATPIVINALGVQDTGADGITGNVPVGIWNATGTTLLDSVTVPSGTSATLIGDYRYVELASPITLAANTNYLIGARSAGGVETAGEGFPGSIYSGDTGVTVLESRFSSAAGLNAPTTTGGTGATAGRWGHANATFVPEPNGIAMTALASALLLVKRRKRTAT